MDALRLEATLKMHLGELSKRLDRATSIARVAEACAAAGNIEKAIAIALDVEQLVYDETTFVNNTASLMSRIYKT